MPTTHRRLLACMYVTLLAAAAACSRPLPAGEECYEGGATAPVLPAYCENLAGTWEDHPNSVDVVLVCLPASDSDECDLCPAEEIDAMLVDEIEEWESRPELAGRPGCDGQYSDLDSFVRGCGGYIEGEGCCYFAWHHAECEYASNY